MKRYLIFFIPFICTITLNAQIPTQIVTNPGTKYVYAGSLTLEEHHSGNCQKLKIEVFGGSWHSDSNGETTFYISNREGLRVNEVRMGSAHGNRFTLQAYKNGTNLDFFLLTSPTYYSSFTVLSYFMGGLLEPGRFVNVTMSDSIPTGTLIPLQIVPVMLTGDSGNIAIKTRTIDPPIAYPLAAQSGQKK